MCELAEKSIWDNDVWKVIVGFSVILTIITSLLQISGILDLWRTLVLPIITFFTSPIPLYSIPLSLLLIFAFVLVVTYLFGSRSIRNPVARAGILDKVCVKHLAILCKNPRTAKFLKKKYNQCLERNSLSGDYLPDELLKVLEARGLFIFQNEKWEVTQKTLDYLKKYHSA